MKIIVDNANDNEHQSKWADFNPNAYFASSMKASPYGYPGMRPTRFMESQIIMPFGQYIAQILNLNIFYNGYLCNGVDENAVGA
uniref:Uncharacterized protein n=1 Tax=Lactuca sativa TaxID=4236 RepID=A0A9R1XUY2_LACSA|nr:hypothetical protein LSAT_V11C100035330 [Lactuca sativa]